MGEPGTGFRILLRTCKWLVATGSDIPHHLPTGNAFGQRARSGVAGDAAQQTTEDLGQGHTEPFGSGFDACAMASMTAILFRGTDGLLLPLDGRAPQVFQLAAIAGCPPAIAQQGVDAAVSWGPDQLLLLQGANYAMYDLNAQSIGAMQPWPLPNGWQWVDGAVEWGEGAVMFTYGKNSVEYDGKGYSAPSPLQWPGWPPAWNDGVDDMLNTGDGYLYFFRGGEAVALSISSGTMAGAPYAISGKQGGGMPDPTPSDNTSAAWCIMGAQGLANGGGKANIGKIEPKGGPSGTYFEDEATDNARVSEIRVWGTSVVKAIQVVLATKDGGQYEQPVHGDPSGQPAVFTLNTDECLVGINGASNGSSGDFVYAPVPHH
ncbi:MAG: hypothetical protein IPO90_04160 [Flavobacteriales bacterium]|nr:hypothetical protein [Flavobacteriales bacterium]